LLELALVTPILALLVMAIFQFAFVLETQMGLENAVREAARRVAAAVPPTTPGQYWVGAGSLQEWAQAQLCGDATPPCDAGLLRQNVQAFEGSRLTTDPPTVKFCSYQVTTASGTQTQYRVDVSLSYSHPLFFGPMGLFTDSIDGNPNQAWDLGVSAQMRLEKIDPAATNYVTPESAGACPP
jgi:Flp pilus assembly protein TadG